MVAAIVENERGDPFLDNGRATTILYLVELGYAAPLAAESLRSTGDQPSTATNPAWKTSWKR